jgi:hypothetical protein
LTLRRLWIGQTAADQQTEQSLLEVAYYNGVMNDRDGDGDAAFLPGSASTAPTYNQELRARRMRVSDPHIIAVFIFFTARDIYVGYYL